MSGFSPQELFSSLRAAYMESLPDKIDEIELSIMALERGNNGREQFEQLFRHIHSLKGSGGTFGINTLTTTCHQMEDELSRASSLTAIDYGALLTHVDILKEIAAKASRDDKDFADIEASLAALKRRQHHNRLHGLIVDISNTGILVLKQALSHYPVSLTFETDGLQALQRLLHEKFDFVIAGKELGTLNGLALIGAVRLNQGSNAHIHSALITSDKNIHSTRDSGPERIIHKDARFHENLHNFIEEVMKTLPNRSKGL